MLISFRAVFFRGQASIISYGHLLDRTLYPEVFTTSNPTQTHEIIYLDYNTDKYHRLSECTYLITIYRLMLNFIFFIS